jgi:hypothetical protein
MFGIAGQGLPEAERGSSCCARASANASNVRVISITRFDGATEPCSKFFGDEMRIHAVADNIGADTGEFSKLSSRPLPLGTD